MTTRRSFRQVTQDLNNRAEDWNYVAWCLYALYPCDDWADDHGATINCDCEEYLEGLFLTVDGAKKYIHESLVPEDIDLPWTESLLNNDNLIARAKSDNSLYYVLSKHLVSD
jgi:hypothetical protein